MVLVVGADVNLAENEDLVDALLSKIAHLRDSGGDAILHLAAYRGQAAKKLVWNDVERMGLGDHVTYHPYYDTCRAFPVFRRDADLWIDNQTSASQLESMDFHLFGERSVQRTVLFVTYMHPFKLEGNSRLMRDWLEHFAAAGYRIHLVYYAGDAPGSVTEEMRSAAREICKVYTEVAVTSPLVGSNNNGLNVHVDDWCGTELLDAISSLVRRFSYDTAFVNYAFLSGVFERVHAYTRKVLLTHDRFEDRNRRMLAQGFAESGWLSLDRSGERLACARADQVIALQKEEAEYFREFCDRDKVIVVSPVLPPKVARRPAPANKLRIGYFGSQNWVNEQNFADFVAGWLRREQLAQNSEIIVAGGVCERLEHFMPVADMERAAPMLMGKVEDLSQFFAVCDVVINPERGGTGLKIKSLETLAHGVPLLSTEAGAVGFESSSRFHNASNIDELVGLVADVASDRSLVEKAQTESIDVYTTYFGRNKSAMEQVLGTKSLRVTPTSDADNWPPRACKVDIRTTPYIDQYAASYHVDQFRTVAERVVLRGKRVLEIGSDYHLISARLFAENGAESVVATNIGDWKSEEPLPGNVTFKVGDVGGMDLQEGGFDLIYGIAILEHIPDFELVAKGLRRFLAPKGVIYLQGCPLWGGSLGHHVWFDPAEADTDTRIRFAADGSKGSPDLAYRFTDPDHNPIPNWAHLSHSPEQLVQLLVQRSVPKEHAKGIVNYVHNLSGDVIGSCSNFKMASEVVEAFRNDFDVHVSSWQFKEEPNEHYSAALKTHSKYDLDTLGLELWMRHKGLEEAIVEDEPLVSIIVPFYGVEAYIADCLASIRSQDYPALEVLLVDDASPDGSRWIAERFCVEDTRFHIVTHEHNRGLGISRNTGAAKAKGEYLFFLDSDDLLAGPDAIRSLVSAARSTHSTVVTGRAQKLLHNGAVEAFDAAFEGYAHAHADTVYRGIWAYYASFGMPGFGYLPMRAWGYLIETDFYRKLRIDFPEGPHEDVGHTPMLCYLAEQVYYAPDVIVHYRHRSESISNSLWSAEKAEAFVAVWSHFRTLLERFGLLHEIGNAALMTGRHALWKMQINKIEQNELPRLVAALNAIMRDASGVTQTEFLTDTWRLLSDTLKVIGVSEDIRRQAIAGLPPESVISYHRAALGLAGATPLENKAAPIPRDAFSANSNVAARIIDQYREHETEGARTYPCMLTEGDKALYYHAGLTYRGKGTIVDGGCFVGGTTSQLVRGLRDNPRFAENDPALAKIVKVYDLFRIDDGYILDHLRQNFPNRTFAIGDSFKPVFGELMEPHAHYFEVFPGDVTKSGYSFFEPIEVLGVDLCKALSVTDYVVREFFPRIVKGGLVIQQDFIHEFHPHIHLSMLRLQDYFELDVEMKWGGSVSFRLRKPITPELIEERFGTNDNWFREIDKNVPLLRSLINRTLYDENRWIMILTLGFYYYAMGDAEQARATFEEAVARYPQYTPSEITRRHLAG